MEYAYAFLSRRFDITKFGYVITACRDNFSAHFTNSRVKFDRRQTNVIAMIWQDEATLSDSPNIYFEISYCIDKLHINDILSLKKMINYGCEPGSIAV